MCQVFEDPDATEEMDGVAVVIVVADTGCGMSTEKLESIFREFEQVEAPLPAAAPSSKGLGSSLRCHHRTPLNCSLTHPLDRLGPGCRGSYRRAARRAAARGLESRRGQSVLVLGRLCH